VRVRQPPGTGYNDGNAPAGASRTLPSAAAGVRDRDLAGGGDGASGAGSVRRHPDPWKTAFFGVLVVAVLAGAGWALLGSSLLVVRHVEVTGARLVTAAEVRQAAQIRMGAPLATIDTAAAASRVERLAPVLSATVSRSWPDGVVISVRERTPVLAVALIGGSYELVDPYGVVVSTVSRRPAGIALLSSPPAVLPGSPAVRAAAEVLQRLPGTLRRRMVSVSAASAGAVTLHLRHGITVLWGSPGQAARKAAELTLLLKTNARYYDVSDPATAVTQG